MAKQGFERWLGGQIENETYRNSDHGLTLNSIVSSAATFLSTEPLCGACHAAFLSQGDVIHHHSLVSLAASANAGCYLCLKLASELNEIVSSKVSPRDIQCRFRWSETSKTPYRILFSLKYKNENDEGDKLEREYSSLSVWNEEDFKDYATFPKVSRDSILSLPRSEHLARYWYRSCVGLSEHEHKMCNRREEKWLPTRLLDINLAKKTNVLRTIFPNSASDTIQDGDTYATLSWCWGPRGPEGVPLLLSGNLDDRQNLGLPLSVLPQTFVDAIEIANWLDIKWLWIDALCIIQDSVADWVQEAEQMSNTYSSAVLNISADCSGDAFGGCFRACPQSKLQPWEMDDSASCVLPPHLDENSANHSDNQVRSKRMVLQLFKNWDREPTTSRAWISRERQLSRRILHFSSTEMMWECCEVNASETFPRGAPDLFQDFKYQTMITNVSEGPQEDKYKAWEILCYLHSQQNITRRSDLAIIMSGLAYDFAPYLPNDTYLAGLWLRTLPTSLLWKRSDSTEICPRELDETGSQVSMPSWSWLSSRKPIETCLNEMPHCPLLKISLIQIDKTLKFHDPKRGGWIKCVGFLRRFTATRLDQANNAILTDDSKSNEAGHAEDQSDEFNEDDNTREALEAYHLATADFERRPVGIGHQNEEGQHIRIWWDDGPVRDSFRSFFCLFVAREPLHEFDRHSLSLKGLMLENTNIGGIWCYKRIGMIEFLGIAGILVKHKVDFETLSKAIEGQRSVTALQHSEGNPGKNKDGLWNAITTEIVMHGDQHSGRTRRREHSPDNNINDYENAKHRDPANVDPSHLYSSWEDHLREVLGFEKIETRTVILA